MGKLNIIRKLFRKKAAHAPALTERMFSAAESNRLIDWTLSYQRINGDLFLQYVTIVLRCRDLSMNNEAVIGLLRNMQRNVIGTSGFSLQSRADNVMLRPEIESLWRDYCSRMAGAVTMDEHSSARDLDILILRSLIIEGECFIHRVYDPRSRYGWRYEVIDSLQIDPYYSVERLGNGGRIWMGVELDVRGREVAYYYRPTIDEAYFSGQRERIPATNMIHLFRREYPAQIRGIPMLAGAVLNLRQLDDYKNAELVHAQISACTMGIWEWNGNNGDDIITDANANDKGEFVREIRPGIFPIAPRGYSAKFLQNTSPNNQFSAFVKNITRSITNSVGLSYNKGSGDYESVNYSSLREAALEDRETYGELQRFLIENWKNVQFLDFIRAAVYSGLIPAQSVESVSRHQFFGRRFSWVDPAKEIAAKEREIALMLTDPISELESRGEDPDDVIARFVDWKSRLEKAGMAAFWEAAFGHTPEVSVSVDDDNQNQTQNGEDNPE